MDILAAQMPGLYADHGESGWYNEDIWRQLMPCPYDASGEHTYGPTWSVGVGVSVAGGGGEAEAKNGGEGCGYGEEGNKLNYIPGRPMSPEGREQ